MPSKNSKSETEEISEAEVIEQEAAESETSAEAESEAPEAAGSSSVIPGLSTFNLVLISGFGLAMVVIMVLLAGGGSEPAEALAQASPETTAMPATIEPAPAPMPAVPATSIERVGEGRHFYTTIRIPANAETLYLSGSGASQKADGSWGSMGRADHRYIQQVQRHAGIPGLEYVRYRSGTGFWRG